MAVSDQHVCRRVGDAAQYSCLGQAFRMIPSTEASLTNMANTHVGIRLAVSDQYDDVVWGIRLH